MVITPETQQAGEEEVGWLAFGWDPGIQADVRSGLNDLIICAKDPTQ
jgi:hypothetical protein